MTRELTVFDAPTCNVHQLLAWVYTGDRRVVAELADDAPPASVWEEVALPDGTQDLVEREVDRRSPLFLYAAATFNGGIAADSWKAAVGEILAALQLGKLDAQGVPNNVGASQPIPRKAWFDLTFYFEPDVAAPRDVLRMNATRWHSLKFESLQVLKLWPDPLASVQIRNHINAPPEPLSDKALAVYLRFDIWTALEAVFVLHGRVPRNEENADDELWAHFLDAHGHLVRGLLGGAVGRKVERAGEPVWVDSPLAWWRWAAQKEWPLDARVIGHFSGATDSGPPLPETSHPARASRSHAEEPPSGHILQRARILKRNEAWQRRANELWAKNPGLSAAGVAKVIAGEDIAGGKSQNTIRQAIKKPRQRRPKQKS